MAASRSLLLSIPALLCVAACTPATSSKRSEPAPAAPISADASVLPVDAAADASPDAATCDLTGFWSFGDAACNACVEQHCCAEIGACQVDAPCTAYVQCELSCVFGSNTCQQGCDAMYPSAIPKYKAFTTCLAQSSCMTTCS